MRVVLDASVAVKWLLPEADSEKARDVLSGWNEGRVELVAPSLLLAEVANVFWKKVGKRETDPSQAAHVFREFCFLGVPLVPVEELVLPALDFSLLYKHSVYDCIYVALAVRDRCNLLSADEKLFRTFGKPPLRMVRLLKDWRQ